MILINLLPPELRRSRREGINPVYLAAAAGILLVAGVGATWAWVHFSRIAAAEQLLAKREEELIAATKAADKVAEIDKEITAFESLHGTITGLITRKVFWARTLDDFANLLAQSNESRWTMEGYEVRCTSLTIAPAAAAAAQRGAPRGGKGGESISYSFRATYKLLGEKRDLAGDYVRSFFQSVDMSRFWREHGFAGRSEDPYKGESPKDAGEIDRVVIDLPLEWRRIKVLPGAQAGAQR